LSRPRIVITGLGVVSPNAIGASAFHRACVAGTSGIRRPVGFDESKISFKTSAVGQIVDFDLSTILDHAELKRVPRMVPLAIAAAREALGMAGVNIAPDDIAAQRAIGVALGTGGGGVAFLEEQYRNLFERGASSLYSITSGTHGNLASELSINLRLRGPSHVLSTGCTSSTDAIGYATLLIQNDIVPMMLVGGADSPIAPGILSAFERMRVVSTRRWDDPVQASRPFSPDRDGFVLGEGAWMFVIESLEHAQARGATPLAEVAGYGSTCDAYHRVQIAPDVAEPVRAIDTAINNAGIHKSQVGYINYHGTSTEMNDRMETLAIKACFGKHAERIPGSSTKSMIGHPQGACGAAGIAATVLSLKSGIFHPTINLHASDPACDLDYIPNSARHINTEYALCNCIAFGSKNSAIVLRHL